MVIKGPTGLYTEPGAIQIDENAGADQKMRVMLQDSVVYNVTIKVSDNDLGFDDQASPNTREIHFGIVVGPTTMEIRTIDKSNENF